MPAASAAALATAAVRIVMRRIGLLERGSGEDRATLGPLGGGGNREPTLRSAPARPARPPSLGQPHAKARAVGCARELEYVSGCSWQAVAHGAGARRRR